MTGNEGQQYPPQDPTPEYWQQYQQQAQQQPYEQAPPEQALYPQEPYQQDPYGQPPLPQQQYQSQDRPYGYDGQPQQPADPDYPAAGGYGTGGYDTGQYDTGQYDTGGYQNPGYGGSGYDGSGYATGYDTGGYQSAPAPGGYGTGQYPAAQPAAQPVAQSFAPPAAPAPAPAPPAARRAPAPAEAPPVPPQRSRPAPAGGTAAPGSAAGKGAGYVNEEFTFVDDAEESEDVIDWMKFSETRGERRDERRRRIRGRLLALAVALVVLAASGVGYLWAKGKLGSSGHTVAAATSREVIAVHLHDLSDNVYTALLVSDPGSHQGATLLIPGNLNLPSQNGGTSVPLATNVDTEGNPAIRTGLNTLLGSNITASWGLYTSFLQLLVDHLNGISVDSNATITQGGKTLVSPGTATLNGAAAVAYATYQAKGETQSAQMARFGQVLEGVIKAMPQDPTSAASDITSMGEVADPSLPDSTLGALMAALSVDANAGGYQTDTLPVAADGSLGAGADNVVKQLLGGTVTSGSGQAAAARVSVVNASGVANNSNLADATVTNNGYTLVPGGGTDSSTQTGSTVSYTDDARAADARQLAEDLNLPASAVRKVTTQQSVDLVVVLGTDYHQD